MIQTFNVVCVTKRYGRNDERQSWHEPITGVAEISYKLEALNNRYVYDVIVVRFNGRDYAYAGARTGLNGTCVIITIRLSCEEVWELYTDTPAPLDKPSTPEEIRELASRAIENRRRYS